MDWPTIQKRMPWSLVLLLGGGFTLAKACDVSGKLVFVFLFSDFHNSLFRSLSVDWQPLGGPPGFGQEDSASHHQRRHSSSDRSDLKRCHCFHSPANPQRPGICYLIFIEQVSYICFIF